MRYAARRASLPFCAGSTISLTTIPNFLSPRIPLFLWPTPPPAFLPVPEAY